MYFIEFHALDLSGSIQPATGDRSVIILDGRESASTHHDIARVEGAKRGYHAYRICKGDSFSRIHRAADLHYIGS